MSPLRRLLLFVTLALLGAALLVHARLPRPQTEGDKWLWEQAETTSALTISIGPRGRALQHQMGLSGSPNTFFYTDTWTDVRDRQGMRDVLRALGGTPAFTPLPATRVLSQQALWERAVVEISIHDGEALWLCREPQGLFLYRQQARMVAPISKEEWEHLRAALQKVITRAKRHQDGYFLNGLWLLKS